MKKGVLFALIIGVCYSLMAQTFSSVAPSGQTLYYRINTWDMTANLTYDNGNWWGAYQGLTGPLVIPDSVSYNGYRYPVIMIDSGCFRGNVGLTSVTIPIHLRRIDYNAFAECTGITTINYNADSCILGWSNDYNAGIFEGCVNVTTVNIGDSVRYVPPFVFYDCIGLQTLNVGKSVVRFHNDALPYEPTNLTTLNFNARRCESYYSNSSHESQYYDFTSGDFRNFKEYSPFEGCTNLTNITIGNEVEGLFSRFFWCCTGLTSVVIPESVISMKYCFAGCTHLNTVTIGGSVEQIQGAFNGCSHLTTINTRAEYPPICDQYTFNGVPAYADIIVPCGAAYRYQLTNYWMNFSRITEDCNAIDYTEDLSNAQINVIDGCIVVEGAENNTVWLYDVNGRVMATKQDEYSPLRFDVPASGAYMVKIGNHPARKVVVVR